jgi:hypothetical protein
VYGGDCGGHRHDGGDNHLVIAVMVVATSLEVSIQ